MVQAFREVSAMKYAGTPGCGKINGLLPAGHDDPYHALVLPHERGGRCIAFCAGMYHC